MAQQFIRNTAYNRNFGTGAGEVPSGDDSRFPVTILVDDFLALAAASGLVTGRWYFVPDADPDAPLWAYATSASQFETVNPASAMYQDTDMNGYTMFASDPTEGRLGSVTTLDVPAGKILGIVGSSVAAPTDDADLDRDVIVAGQSARILSPQIQMYFPGAEVGGTLVISSVEGNMATITAVPPVPPAYTVLATDSTDIPVVSDGATWTVVASGTAPDFPTVQAFAIGDSARYSLKIENSGQSAATIDIGFQSEDAAVPGVWSGPNYWFSHVVTAGSTSVYSNQSLIASAIPTNTNLRMVARSTAVPTTTDLGAWLYVGNALDPVADGMFSTDDRKMSTTTELRIAKINDAGQDVGAFLLDLQTGVSAITMSQGADQATYDLVSVTDDVAGASVYLALSNGVGSAANWSGLSVLRGTLANGLAVITTLGSESPTYFEVFEV